MTTTALDALRIAVASRVQDACRKAYGACPDRVSVSFPNPTKKTRGQEWFGDFSVGCFPLAQQFGQRPNQIAARLQELIVPDDCIQQVEAVGPYLNIHIRAQFLFSTLDADQFMDVGSLAVETPQRIMVEYLSPNTNKPLHLGHVRNGVLGMALSGMLHAAGHTVIRANLVNDRGVHICRTMYLYQMLGGGVTPEMLKVKGDHYVGNWYVAYGALERLGGKLNPAILTAPQELLQRWEQGDPEVRALWERMNSWVYAGFEETYQRYGFAFDVFYYESDTYTLGRDIIDDGLARGIFIRQEDGSIILPLPEEIFGLDKFDNPKISSLIRSDGTTVYITQDFGTAVRKFEEHQLDRSIYVVGDEQNYHFQCLFYGLGVLGYEWAGQCYHLSYGMVNLPDGKMKSREGNVVDADDLLEDTKKSVLTVMDQQQQQRDAADRMSNEKLDQIAEVVALSAIKLFLLRFDPKKKITFDPKNSVSFEGATGPYLLYTYARCQSILRRAEEAGFSLEPDFSLLDSSVERMLARHVMAMPEIIVQSAEKLSPTTAITGILELASTFNQFYAAQRVFGEDVSPELTLARARLVAATARALKLGLSTLNIDTVDEM